MAGLSTPKQKLSALIITYNEMGYIERCIESVSFADEIVVVDSFSTDGTFEYLQNHPKVRVLQHPFDLINRVDLPGKDAIKSGIFTQNGDFGWPTIIDMISLQF